MMNEFHGKNAMVFVSLWEGLRRTVILTETFVCPLYSELNMKWRNTHIAIIQQCFCWLPFLIFIHWKCLTAFNSSWTQTFLLHEPSGKFFSSYGSMNWFFFSAEVIFLFACFSRTLKSCREHWLLYCVTCTRMIKVSSFLFFVRFGRWFHISDPQPYFTIIEEIAICHWKTHLQVNASEKSIMANNFIFLVSTLSFSYCKVSILALLFLLSFIVWKRNFSTFCEEFFSLMNFNFNETK